MTRGDGRFGGNVFACRAKNGPVLDVRKVDHPEWCWAQGEATKAYRLAKTVLDIGHQLFRILLGSEYKREHSVLGNWLARLLFPAIRTKFGTTNFDAIELGDSDCQLLFEFSVFQILGE